MRRARGRTRRACFPLRRTFSAPAGASGTEDCSTRHKSGIIGVYAAGRGMMRRACFALRVIEAPQSAAAQPASASLWDLLLGWLA